MRDVKFPVGPYAVRKRENNFEEVILSETDNDAIMWLSYVQMTRGITMRTMYNQREVEIYIHSLAKTVRVDGCSKDDNGRLLVFEFLECGKHHGKCPSCVVELKRKKKKETSRSERLRKETMERIEGIKNDASIASIEWIWMCDWLKKKGEDPSVKDFVSRFTRSNGAKFYENERDLLDDVLIDEKLHGMILATFKVEDHRMEEMDEFPIFFQRADVEPTGALLELLKAKRCKIPPPTSTVVQSHSMTGWMTTDCLKYYYGLLGDDLLITNVEVSTTTYNTYLRTYLTHLVIFRHSSKVL